MTLSQRSKPTCYSTAYSFLKLGLSATAQATPSSSPATRMQDTDSSNSVSSTWRVFDDLALRKCEQLSNTMASQLSGTASGMSHWAANIPFCIHLSASVQMLTPLRYGESQGGKERTSINSIYVNSKKKTRDHWRTWQNSYCILKHTHLSTLSSHWRSAHQSQKTKEGMFSLVRPQYRANGKAHSTPKAQLCQGGGIKT